MAPPPPGAFTVAVKCFGSSTTGWFGALLGDGTTVGVGDGVPPACDFGGMVDDGDGDEALVVGAGAEEPSLLHPASSKAAGNATAATAMKVFLMMLLLGVPLQHRRPGCLTGKNARPATSVA